MKQIDILDVLDDLLAAFRVRSFLLTHNSKDFDNLDFRFRGQLYQNYDYKPLFEKMTAAVTPEQPVEYTDNFGLHYMILEEEPNGGEPIYRIIGPFLYAQPAELSSDVEFYQFVESKGIPQHHAEQVKAFYLRITVIYDMLAWKFMLGKLFSRYFDKTTTFQEVTDTTTFTELQNEQMNFVPKSTLAYSALEARYDIEKKMLAAIKEGNTADALYYHNLFMGFSFEVRNSSQLRNAQDYVITANTIFRKAVEEAYVHPLYIDQMSGKFIIDIEKATSLIQLNRICTSMICKYCLLVRSYSREKYSQLIRDCLNYIDFHYQEPLSLIFFAKKYVVSKNYLSSLFHQEVKMTLTDYINSTRVHHSILLLNTTSLPMQSIAEQCGFSDANYFTRIFKKIQGMTPLKYRQSLLQ